MTEFIYPPRHIETQTRPVVFLAGPVQGTYDWQAGVAERLRTLGANADIVSPRGQDDLYTQPSQWLESGQQNPWERRYLRLARDMGVIAFWLAAQEYGTPGRAYAQTTRIELGRVAGWKDYNPAIKLVFGVDQRYQGGNQTYMEEVCEELGVPVQRDLNDMSEAIITELTS